MVDLIPDIQFFINVRRKQFFPLHESETPDDSLKANKILIDCKDITKTGYGAEVEFQNFLPVILKEAFENPDQVGSNKEELKDLSLAIKSFESFLKPEYQKSENLGPSGKYNYEDIFRFISESIFIEISFDFDFDNHRKKVQGHHFLPILENIFNCKHCIKAFGISIFNYLNNPKPVVTGIALKTPNNIQLTDSSSMIGNEIFILDGSNVQGVSPSVSGSVSTEKVLSGWKMVNRPLTTNIEPETTKPAGWVWSAPDKDLPPPPGKQWVESPDGYCEGKDFKNGKIIGAVVRGRSHKQNAVYCDDSFKFSVENENWQIVVVSDGVGAALLSRFGSDAAVKAATDILANGLKSINFKGLSISDAEQKGNSHSLYPSIRQAFFDAFKAAKIAIEELKDKDNSAADINRKSVDKILRLDPNRNARRIENLNSDQLVELLTKDYACTLLAFAVTDARYEKPDGQKVAVKLIASCAVGDGMMGIFRKPNLPYNAMELMTGADGGQFSGMVVPLTGFSLNEDVIFHRTRIDLVGDVLAVVAMTDGVSEDYNLMPSPLGLQQLACDLIINGILPVEGAKEELTVDKFKACNKLIADRAAKAEKEIIDLIAQKGATRNVTDQFVMDQKIIKLREIADATKIGDLFKLQAPLLNPASGDPSLVIKYINSFFELMGKKSSDILCDPDFLKAIRDAAPLIIDSSDQDGVNREAAILKLWLDYYFVRGSFDDRTLVMAKFNGAV